MSPSSDRREFDGAAAGFSRACEAVGIRHAFVGGLAVIVWGQPRTTADIDAIASVPPEKVPALVAALKQEGFSASGQDFLDGLREGTHITVFDERSAFHVDVKPALTRDDLDQVEAAVVVPGPNGPLRVARPEDTVAYKLKFGSPQDIADARSILARQEHKLDASRLTGLAVRLGVAEALARLEREVERAGVKK